MFINRVNRLKKKITLYNDNDSGNSSQCNDCVDYDLGVYYYLLLTQNSTTRYCQLLLQHHQISNKTITILFFEMLFLLKVIFELCISFNFEKIIFQMICTRLINIRSHHAFIIYLCVSFSFFGILVLSK